MLTAVLVEKPSRDSLSQGLIIDRGLSSLRREAFELGELCLLCVVLVWGKSGPRTPVN